MKNKVCAATAVLLMLQPGIAAAHYNRAALVHEERGAFAGARLHLPLGGKAERPRAGIAVSGMQRARDGHLRLAKGVELGVGAEGRLGLAVGGVPLGAAGQAQRKAGVSALGWVAIGVGVIAVSVVSLYALCGSGAICSTDDE